MSRIVSNRVPNGRAQYSASELANHRPPARSAVWFSRQRDRLVGRGLPMQCDPAPASYVPVPPPHAPPAPAPAPAPAPPGRMHPRPWGPAPDEYMWEQVRDLRWRLACDGVMSAGELSRRLATQSLAWRASMAAFICRQAASLRDAGGAALRASPGVRRECVALGKDYCDTVRDTPDYIQFVEGEAQGIDIVALLNAEDK